MRYLEAIDSICDLRWESLGYRDLVAVSRAYYYFSVQFRENLLLAQQARPLDMQLSQLVAGECNTDNLSPFPGVATPGERMNHDDFMARLLKLSTFPHDPRVDALGHLYLQRVRCMDDVIRIMSIASYEDGGLERVFTAILDAPEWHGPSLLAFRHFLLEHIRFDSDPEGGHGALSRHIEVDDRVLPLWQSFYDLLTEAVPALQTSEMMRKRPLWAGEVDRQPQCAAPHSA